MEFYRNGTLLGTTTTAPYSYAWTNVAPGSYSLTAKAYDNAGAVTTSAAIAIQVATNQPPSYIRIMSPIIGSGRSVFVAPASIEFVVDANDTYSGQPLRVELFANGTLLGTATAPQTPGDSTYDYTWNVATPGTYNVTARATDSGGLFIDSTSLTVNITAANTRPTVNMAMPANGSVFTSPATVVLGANAADSDGSIARVDFYAGTSLVGSATGAPYSTNWNATTAGTYMLTARAVDDTGAVTASAPVYVQVNATNRPPLVTLTAPAPCNSCPLGADIPLAAQALDPDGTIAKVEFYADGVLVNTALSAPYGAVWQNPQGGTHLLTAAATDNAGARTTSSAVRAIVTTTNIPPTVNLTSPANGAAFSTPATIALAATASDSDGTVSKVEFYRNGTLLGTSTAAPYSYTWTNAAPGSYSLTAKAYDNTGATTTSAAIAIQVTVPNQAPTVAITAPANNASFSAPATVTIGATAADADGTVSKVEFYKDGALLGTATASPYTFTWSNVAPGNYTLTAKAYDNAGATTTSTPVAISVSALPLVITSPNDQATINSDLIMVSGMVQAPANSGITVNGVVAAIDGTGHFYANGVTLSEGSNGIAATLTTPDGQATTQSITVTSTGPSPVKVAASPTQGMAPLVVTFSISAQPGITLQKVEFDFDGNGSIDQTLIAPAWASTATYSGTGTLSPIVKVTDAQGNVYSQTIPIVLTDPAQLDQILRAVWSGMTNALAAGNKATAMRYLSASAQDRYGPVFDALLPNMQPIVATFSAPQSIGLSGDLGEYAINRMVNGVNALFFIYFTLDGDGVWRLSSM